MYQTASVTRSCRHLPDAYHHDRGDWQTHNAALLTIRQHIPAGQRRLSDALTTRDDA